MNKFNLTTQTLIKTQGSIYEGYRLGDAIKDKKFLGWCSSHIDRIQTKAGSNIDFLDLHIIERYQALIHFAEENKPNDSKD